MLPLLAVLTSAPVTAIRAPFDRGWREMQHEPAAPALVVDTPRSALDAAPLQLLCTPTPPRDAIPGVDVVPGFDPVWLVTTGRWSPDREGMAKTLWIMRTTREPVRVEGREVRGGAPPRFQHGGLETPITDTMVIEDPWRESVIPGGQTSELKNQYLFFTSYVFYPAPGCYEFTITREQARHRIVVEVK